MLYNLLTDRAPYAGSSLSEVLERARRADVAPPRRMDPSIPAPLEAVCLKALAAAPENRYAMALEFAAALRRSIEPTSTQAATPTPARLPARMRRGLLAAAVILSGLLAASAWWLWPRGARTTTAAEPPDVPATAADPLHAGIAVSHYKELGDGHRVVPRGTISGTSLAGDPPRLKDLVQVRVTLSRPAYIYLIALNPDGTTQACVPAGGGLTGPPRRELEFPEDPEEYFDLTDGVGLQAFVVVASDRRLPAYESWEAQVPGGLTWSRLDQEGFWTYDSAASSEADRPRGRHRGKIVRREAAPEALVGLCDRLRQSPGVNLVRAVAFPVKPDQDGMK